MQAIAIVLFLFSGVCFIMGLKFLGKGHTARRGNYVSATGMTAAAVGMIFHIIAQSDGTFEFTSLGWILAGMVVGTAIGIPAAKLVKMTAMPEMVALFNGSGGIASLLVGWAEIQKAWSLTSETTAVTDIIPNASVVAVYLAVLIGGVTFTGSLVAFGKLSEKLPGPPILYPGQRIINGLILLALVVGGVWLTIDPSMSTLLYVAIALSFVLGVAFVIPIGGGDMPVVIALLNSYSGLAACAAGFAIGETLLIITGALVGASGLILTRIMCLAMNRSLPNVLFSGFGAVETGGPAGDQEKKEAKILTPDKAFFMLEAAQKVIFVPGYGMAVAQAQHAVKELATLMEANGTEVDFIVHPVAGRMPGHMNVLLAEADVPYESLAELEDVNPTMENVDVAIVLGANDVVNPLAVWDEKSSIAGMPIVEVHRAKTIFTLKRSLRSGYAGIDNPLFYLDNNYMVLGDAKETLTSLIDEFKSES